MKKTIILTFSLIYSSGLLFADFEFIPPCGYGASQDYNLTIMGDSRAFTLAAREYASDGDFIRDSKLEHDGNSRNIFADDVEIETLNLGWPGVGLEVKVLNKNWPERYDSCMEEGYPYYTHENVILNIGGNDVLKFYDRVAEAEAFYLLSGLADSYKSYYESLENPLTSLASLFDGGQPSPDDMFEGYWFWQFETKTDSLYNKYYKFAAKILNNNPSRLMIVDIAPVTGPGVYQYVLGNGGDGLIPEEVRKDIYVSRMNVMYYTRLYPDLISAYGNRVYFVDVFNRFLRNILEEQSSFYAWPAEDYVHYSDEGDKEFGRIVSTAMAYHGWYSKNPDFTDDQLSDYFSGEPVDLSYLIPDAEGDCDIGCVIVVCGALGCL